MMGGAWWMLVSLLSHVYSYSICCMSESMFSAYTKKKNYFPHGSSFVFCTCNE
ncbi:hypothetical protein GLYMA_15G096900v4 [Glycine max]|nr:hypothetical protein GLYMA_15G096900v4 [Glycine max]KAH1146430.1 hypothetical protein GYH30_041872 [Glycine max]